MSRLFCTTAEQALPLLTCLRPSRSSHRAWQVTIWLGEGNGGGSGDGGKGTDGGDGDGGSGGGGDGGSGDQGWDRGETGGLLGSCGGASGGGGGGCVEGGVSGGTDGDCRGGSCSPWLELGGRGGGRLVGRTICLSALESLLDLGWATSHNNGSSCDASCSSWRRRVRAVMLLGGSSDGRHSVLPSVSGAPRRRAAVPSTHRVHARMPREGAYVSSRQGAQPVL